MRKISKRCLRYLPLSPFFGFLSTLLTVLSLVILPFISRFGDAGSAVWIGINTVSSLCGYAAVAAAVVCLWGIADLSPKFVTAWRLRIVALLLRCATLLFFEADLTEKPLLSGIADSLLTIGENILSVFAAWFLLNGLANMLTAMDDLREKKRCRRTAAACLVYLAGDTLLSLVSAFMGEPDENAWVGIGLAVTVSEILFLLYELILELAIWIAVYRGCEHVYVGLRKGAFLQRNE